MKKYLSIVILVICVFMFTACHNTVKENVNNDVNVNLQESVGKPDENTQQESPEINNPIVENTDENIDKDNLENEEELIEKFKLSDDISLSYDMKENSLYNLFYYKPILNSYQFNLNGNNHVFSTKGDFFGVLLIDNKEITSAIGDENFKNRSISGIGVIYLENEPFIIMRYVEGSAAGDFLYSINNNLELVFNNRFEELYKVGDKYIEPTFFAKADFDHMSEGIVIGYWYYEDSEWKYVNRSINGKILIDEEGNFSEDLYIEGSGIYSRGFYYRNLSTQKLESDAVLLTTSKYRIIKQYPDLNYTFDIEMLEDSTWGIVKLEDIYDTNNYDYSGNWVSEIENEEHIPAGTIVKKVEFESSSF